MRGRGLLYREAPSLALLYSMLPLQSACGGFVEEEDDVGVILQDGRGDLGGHVVVDGRTGKGR